MKRRIPLLAVVLLALVLLIVAALVIDLPRAIYARRAAEAYNRALALWESVGPTTYTMVVASNSLSQPTGGWNTIRVQDARVVEGHNPDCPGCLPEVFEPLTVEALFQRIGAQCLLDFPFQFCGVAYDEMLGFPLRIDTYPHNQDGVERPSITVESVEGLKP